MDEYTMSVVQYIEMEHSLEGVVDIEGLRYIDEGYVSSLGIVQLIYSLEADYAIEFTDEELGSCDIRTIGGLAGVVRRKHESGE